MLFRSFHNINAFSFLLSHDICDDTALKASDVTTYNIKGMCPKKRLNKIKESKRNNGEAPCVMYVQDISIFGLASPKDSLRLDRVCELRHVASRTIASLLGASPDRECSGLCTNTGIQHL